MAVAARPGIASRRHTRGAAQAAVDGVLWVCALLSAAWIRYEFTITTEQFRTVLLTAMLAFVFQNAIGHPLFLYRGRHAFGSFDEVRAVFGAVSGATVVLFTGNLAADPQPLATSTPLTGGALALVLMLTVRYVRRLQWERRMHPNLTTATRVLVIGAGATASWLVRAMLRDPAGKYRPVGLLDDDPTKRHLRVAGVPVLGRCRDLVAAVADSGVSTVVFAIPSAPPALVRDVRRLAEDAGAAFKVLPSVNSLLDRRVTVADIRDVNVTDLLGRGQVETDLAAIGGYLTGRRVLVTGAGGSIGSELCRQIHQHGPAELIMLDRDESALHAVQLSISGRALLDSPDVLLADLRDVDRVREIFAERRPQVVFHAAALKHQPLLEQYPAEAVKTNIRGTATVLEAAAATGVEVFVNISTDKAADPCSVLGYSKRITERLTAHTARLTDRPYLSVRFGNVLGSRGSVLTTFADQIARGGPITVTDPEVTRYFMTVQEAVQLVIQAGAVGRPGEALVLDMGEPVRIADVARQMATIAGEPIDIVFTGLRRGEKHHESLFGTGEQGVRRTHPLISHVDVPPLAPDLIDVVETGLDPDTVVSQLIGLCGAGATRPTVPGLPLDPWLARGDLTTRSTESDQAADQFESLHTRV